jgi:hypothetical protein
MTLHLIKLSVGSESVEGLAQWQALRLAETGRLFHRTRMMPKRRDELLAGGSIYWVIRGYVRARQHFTEIEREPDEEGRTSTLLLLEPSLHRVLPRVHRPFQGWRYLAPKDAPPDLDQIPGAAGMPAEMAAELHELGLI